MTAAVFRPMRADARRNRDAILQAAREVFASDGVLASLDGIALRAGVGNATLYRNFPTRDDLLAAVMEADLDEALAEAETLAREHSPRIALAEWLVRLTWRLRIWHDLPHCVAEARAAPGSSMNQAVSMLVRQTGELLDQAKAAGAAVSAIEADEVFELVTALSWAVDRFGDDEIAARRRVEVGTAGLFLRSD
ncbi:TetR/AcrR family transcriptional regulator [Sphingomonas nostoxanthinifaciens]|uniref:TetR/AcrR family transcriptional regulator n=1 Tax=Sphingomonas nostoxanthinifaciens TaxID=2872652 RepID=UPI001CC1D347|nr:TetR/AcrR family transcriptional regulator [Sphingomonas nostoxanthinifaciens]UAK23788.1 TetR/AcrR family transcriptional regulator [Sphingomonas nostoxanthinifaciens]